MDFRDLAAKEASALITRLATGSGETSRQRLRAFRTAIEAATKALESALTSQPDVENDVAELVNKLSKAAVADADTRIQRLSAEARKTADALRADLAALAEEKDALAEEKGALARENEALDGSLKQAQAQADAMKAEVTALSKEKHTLAAALKDAHTKADAIRGQLNGLAKEKQALALSLEDAEAKTEALRAELTGLSKDKQTLAASYKDLQATWESLRADLVARTEERDTLSAALSEAQAQADEVQAQAEALQGDLHDERKRTEGYRRELAEARAARQTAEAERDDAVAASEHEVAARLAAERELLDIRGALESGRAESSDAKSQLVLALEERAAALAEKAALQDALSAAESQAQAAETKLASMMTLLKSSSARVKALERQQAESEDALRELEARLTETVAPVATSDRSIAQFESLLESFRALANATTIGDILTTLVEHLAAEFPRVALFHVKGNRLEGGHQIGFDFDNDIAKVVIPLSINSLLTRAVGSGRIERLEGGELADNSGPFGGAPTSALAMPVVVQEETLAIVYADDSGRTDADPATADVNGRFAEALLYHAVALLTRLHTELRTLTELRAYAASLVGEVEQMYAADVTTGKTGNDLKDRLKGNLDFARSLFETRIALESPDSGGLFDDQIGTTIEANASTAFGQDLAAVAGHTPSARAAEAS